MGPNARITGGVLREVRERRAMTLREVGLRSGGTFRPSALGAWERGDRHISLERFCELASFYETPADVLLAEILRRGRARGSEIVDVAAIEGMGRSTGAATVIQATRAAP